MISFVYFDLGGVVIQDFSGTSHWAELKKEWGIVPDQDKVFDDFWDSFESDLCLGKINTAQIPVPEGYEKMLGDFVSRFETNPSIWPVIDEIHATCRIGLLTNMYPGMFEAIKKRDLLPHVAWDVVIKLVAI